VVRPWGPFELEVEGFHFSTQISAPEADALVCEWAPSDELFTFSGPSAWYTCEPRTNRRMGVLRQADHRRSMARLSPEQMLHHAHPDDRFRVPHVTHTEDSRREGDHTRASRACAVVSNYGGPIRNRWPDIDLRNDFATAEDVHLYGRQNKWKHYRPRWNSLPRFPLSYMGEPPPTQAKIDLMAGYQAAICLENTCEAGYFSEKFVDGVRAGCVPVYRAHPTVRDTVLRGAIWVDPGDFDSDPRRTIAHALSLDRAEVAAQNFAWLRTDGVRATHAERVWSSIGAALCAQAA
jgi:hypothetical protein